MDAVYRFEFRPEISPKEIEENLYWAVLNAESIFGKAKVRLDASFYFDKAEKVCIIDKTTEVGQHIAQIFTSCVARAFGDTAFKVVRLRKKKQFTAENDRGQQESGK
ncbi:MAG: hypothetical protein KCHDKBKB_01073 [Elusimicrobia bacterium]|nr:hypothetical protein [Elusimicrobiota bacterium]